MEAHDIKCNNTRRPPETNLTCRSFPRSLAELCGLSVTGSMVHIQLIPEAAYAGCTTTVGKNPRQHLLSIANSTRPVTPAPPTQKKHITPNPHFADKFSTLSTYQIRGQNSACFTMLLFLSSSLQIKIKPSLPLRFVGKLAANPAFAEQLEYRWN